MASNFPCPNLYPHIWQRGWALRSNTSIGVVMDSNLTFNAHITALCKACDFHLRSLRHIRRSLTDDMAILIAVALVQSHLDYCNSLFFNMSCFNINKLQHVQNLAARLVLNDWHSPSQQILVKLHWLKFVFYHYYHYKHKCLWWWIFLAK